MVALLLKPAVRGAAVGRAVAGARRRPLAAALAGWALVVLAGHLLGAALYDRDPLVHIGAAPFVGTFDLRWSARAWPALALGGAAIIWGPALAARLRWRTLVAAGWAAAASWALALAATDGWRTIAAPLRSPYEQLTAVPLVGSPGRFLGSFTDLLPTYATHVRGHPPGGVLALWGLDEIGLGGAGAAALFADRRRRSHRAGGARRGARAGRRGAGPSRGAISSCSPRRRCGWRPRSTRSTPGSALPASRCSRWRAADRAARVGVRARRSPRSPPALVLGAALQLSYGVAVLGAVVLAIAAGRRRADAVAWAAAGVAIVFAAFAAARFNWFDGLAATREEYLAGVSRRRPYADFLLISLAAFALAAGPAVAAGLARLRDRGVWLLAGGALVALAAADLSGMSKGETERIWLHLVPWLLVATAALRGSRGWLAAQIGLALALQLTVRSPW